MSIRQVIWGGKRLVVLIGVIATVVVVGLMIDFSTIAFVDWWPPYGTLTAEWTAQEYNDTYAHADDGREGVIFSCGFRNPSTSRFND